VVQVQIQVLCTFEQYFLLKFPDGVSIFMFRVTEAEKRLDTADLEVFGKKYRCSVRRLIGSLLGSIKVIKITDVFNVLLRYN